MKVDLTKKYRIWWKQDKTLPSTYREPHSLSTTTTLDSQEWNYFESDTVTELDNRVSEVGFVIEEDNEQL